MQAPGVSSVWGLGETGSLCPVGGWSAPLQTCSKIRDLSAALGTKQRGSTARPTGSQEARLATGEEAARTWVF